MLDLFPKGHKFMDLLFTLQEQKSLPKGLS